jgi:hypothetical protein
MRTVSRARFGKTYEALIFPSGRCPERIVERLAAQAHGSFRDLHISEISNLFINFCDQDME